MLPFERMTRYHLLAAYTHRLFHVQILHTLFQTDQSPVANIRIRKTPMPSLL